MDLEYLIEEENYFVYISKTECDSWISTILLADIKQNEDISTLFIKEDNNGIMYLHGYTFVINGEKIYFPLRIKEEETPMIHLGRN